MLYNGHYNETRVCSISIEKVVSLNMNWLAGNGCFQDILMLFVCVIS